MLGISAVYWHPLTAQELPRSENSAKARLLSQQMIVALGGQVFQDVRDSDCSGQIAQFGHNGEVVIYAPFREMWLLPDKNRTEYSFKGQILITVFSGEKGWILDRSGVSDQSEVAIKSFTEQVAFGMYNTLRSRWSEKGVQLNYAGKDSIDLKGVEWIESSEGNDRLLRLAIEQSTHLPLRWVVSSTNLEMGERTEDATNYAQFAPNDGVQTPLSISRMQNDRLISQILLTSCKYNSNLSPELFTRTALEQRQKEVAKKGS
jgi:hypothetical protein